MTDVGGNRTCRAGVEGAAYAESMTVPAQDPDGSGCRGHGIIYRLAIRLKGKMPQRVDSATAFWEKSDDRNSDIFSLKNLVLWDKPAPAMRGARDIRLCQEKTSKEFRTQEPESRRLDSPSAYSPA